MSINFHPIQVPFFNFNVLRFAEVARSHFERHQWYTIDETVLGKWAYKPEGKAPTLCTGLPAALEPRCIFPQGVPDITGIEITGQSSKMACHGAFVSKVAHGDFDDFIAIVSQPGADALVLFRSRRVAVEMTAQAVQIKADTFVLVVVRCAVDDVRGSRSNGAVKADLSAADPLLETGRQKQVP